MIFAQTLKHILDTKTSIKPSTLYGLSKLEIDQVERLTAVWTSIPTARRRTLVKELLEITEGNFEVNFDPIFRWGLIDSDPEVRATSIEGLWENEEPALMISLLNLLKNDPSNQVRAVAAISLGRFILLGELDKIPAERCQPVYQVLHDLVVQDTENLEIRRRALESLAYASDETVAQLLQEAYDHTEETMHISAVFGMGRSVDERWIETVMGELGNINPEMRYGAARACGELEARAAVPRLSELIEDPDREVQEVTLWALGQIGGKQARRLLEICCQEGDEVTRSAAEAALEEFELMHEQIDLPFHDFDKLDNIKADPS